MAYKFPAEPWLTLGRKGRPGGMVPAVYMVGIEVAKAAWAAGWKFELEWGYAPGRPASSEHGQGRAIDFMGFIDSQLTIDPDLLEWLWRYLWKHRQRLGLEYEISKRRIRSTVYEAGKVRYYGGKNPHTDHVHATFRKSFTKYVPPKALPKGEGGEAMHVELFNLRKRKPQVIAVGRRTRIDFDACPDAGKGELQGDGGYRYDGPTAAARMELSALGIKGVPAGGSVQLFLSRTRNGKTTVEWIADWARTSGSQKVGAVTTVQAKRGDVFRWQVKVIGGSRKPKGSSVVTSITSGKWIGD